MSKKTHEVTSKMSKTQKLDFQNVGIRQKMSKNKGMVEHPIVLVISLF